MQQPPICLETQHHSNIFGVAILPETDNTCIASGAMDHSVQLHQLDHDHSNPRSPPFRAN